MKIIIGIDAGMSGGIAVFKNSEIFTFSLKNTSDEQKVSFIREYAENSIAYLETVGGYIPDTEGNGQPGSRMFTFGDNYGYLRGILDTLGIKRVGVIPQVWQRGIAGRKGSYSERKRALRAHAEKLFPALKVTAETADALGILHYALFREGVSNSGYAAGPVANPDESQAVKWCRASGHPVPGYGTIEYADMVRYWVQSVKGAA